MARARLHIRAVLLEPSLFAHLKYGSRQRVQQKIRRQVPLAAHACLKDGFMEDEKYYNLMTWFSYWCDKTGNKFYQH